MVWRGAESSVWRDAEGKVYRDWNELGLDHLKNVVVLLTKRTEEAQKEWKKQKQDGQPPAYTYYAEERWRQLLLLLEGASQNLKQRLANDNEFELDLAPKTPQEALADAEKLVPGRAFIEKLISQEQIREQRKQTRAKQQANKANTASVGPIVERPRKLRIGES